MNHSINATSLREQLVQQIVLLDDEKSRFLDTYFTRQEKERSEMDHFLSTYTKYIEKLLGATDEDLHASVLIGSSITVNYLEHQFTDTLTIVFPNDADPDENLISFLSPVGKQMLMAAKNEILSIITPSGKMQVRIEGIQPSVT